MTEDQKQAVAAWFAGGASLDEIQKRLKSEFGVHLTYLEVRLLVAELPQPEEGQGTRDEGQGDRDEGEGTRDEGEGNRDKGQGIRDEGGQELSEEVPEEGAKQVEVTIDALMIPGTLASGEVTFSDGQRGKWYLDRMGRLGLGGDLPEGYRPNPADAAVFQSKLMSLLQAKGLC